MTVEAAAATPAPSKKDGEEGNSRGRRVVKAAKAKKNEDPPAAPAEIPTSPDILPRRNPSIVSHKKPSSARTPHAKVCDFPAVFLKPEDSTQEWSDGEIKPVGLKYTSLENVVSKPGEENNSKRKQTVAQSQKIRKIKTGAHRRASREVILEPAQPEVPKTRFHTVVQLVLLDTSRDSEVVLSANMVVRSIGRHSPLFHHLLVGDQLLELNDVILLRPEEFYILYKDAKDCKEAKLRMYLIRPWNVFPPTERRMGTVKRQDNCSYLILEVYKQDLLSSGIELRYAEKKYFKVKTVEWVSGANTIMRGDKILDIDFLPVNLFPDLVSMRTRFNESIERDGKCTLLIERAISLQSSPNPSCYANRVPSTEPEMGEDATEIAAREATRHAHMKDKYRTRPVLQPSVELPKPNQNLMSGQDEKKEETSKHESKKSNKKDSSAKKRKRSLFKRHKKKSTVNESKNEVHRTISDVEDERVLQNVTKKSGLISFVRNYIAR